MPYRALKAEHITATSHQLRARIAERFAGRGIEGVSEELVLVSEDFAKRAVAVGKPFFWLRMLVIAICVAGLSGLGIVIWQNVQHFTLQTSDLSHFEGIEAVVNMVVLTAAGMWFLLNLETRVKRNRILDDMHVLRSLAHVIDMHQLTKDPVAICLPGHETASSPKRDMEPFELLRYLDYLTEMLSLIGKIAALYMERVNDSEVNRSVNEIEDLTTNLSRKIWQKISVIETAEADGGIAHQTPDLADRAKFPGSTSSPVHGGGGPRSGSEGGA